LTQPFFDEPDDQRVDAGTFLGSATLERRERLVIEPANTEVLHGGILEISG
jgi:hypothetical protein